MKFKDVAQLYLGVDVYSISNKYMGKLVSVGVNDQCICADINDDPRGRFSYLSWLKPVIRPLSSMTEEEFNELLPIILYHKNPEFSIDADEVFGEIFYNDGGNEVDADVAVGMDISVRCFEGQIAIRDDGSVHLYSDEKSDLSIYNQPKIFTWMLSKGFDLFGLIESGEAIDATNFNQPATGE